MPPPPSDQIAAATALIEAQSQARQAITEQGVAGVVAAVRSFSAWDDHVAIGQLVAQITRILQPRQRILAGQTDAYLARMLTYLTGKLANGVGTIAVEDLRMGTTMPDVYGRLADNFRYLTSDAGGNLDPQLALDQVANRAASMAETDMDLAFTHQAQEFTMHKVITGYRRVIHPEMSAGGTCGLCIVASDRIYKREQLLPIHGRCKCTVVPIVGGEDLGHHLNGEDLVQVYSDAGSNKARALKETRYRVNQHGELGPVLTYAQDRFRGPADIPAA